MDLDSVMIGMSKEHGLPRGSPGKQDHIRSAIEMFGITMVQACLMDDDEEMLVFARADGASGVHCPAKGGDEVAGKAVLEALASVVAQDPSVLENKAKHGEAEAAEIPTIALPAKNARRINPNEPLPSMGVRLAPRRNQFGYKDPAKKNAADEAPVRDQADATKEDSTADADDASEDIASRNAKLLELKQRLSQHQRPLTKKERIEKEMKVFEERKRHAENNPPQVVEPPATIGSMMAVLKDEVIGALSRSPWSTPVGTPRASPQVSPDSSPARTRPQSSSPLEELSHVANRDQPYLRMAPRRNQIGYKEPTKGNTEPALQLEHTSESSAAIVHEALQSVAAQAEGVAAENSEAAIILGREEGEARAAKAGGKGNRSVPMTKQELDQHRVSSTQADQLRAVRAQAQALAELEQAESAPAVPDVEDSTADAAKL